MVWTLPSFHIRIFLLIIVWFKSLLQCHFYWKVFLHLIKLKQLRGGWDNGPKIPYSTFFIPIYHMPNYCTLNLPISKLLYPQSTIFQIIVPPICHIPNYCTPNLPHSKLLYPQSATFQIIVRPICHIINYCTPNLSYSKLLYPQSAIFQILCQPLNLNVTVRSTVHTAIENLIWP